MNSRPVTPSGLNFLDRRNFLSRFVDGVGGIALAALLAERGLLAEGDSRPAPYRPEIDPSRPYGPRPAPLKPRAESVLVVHCSGALSPVDMFEYKPALERYHGKALPGNESLVTFQGENGNLHRPLWKFRPRGECGKMLSDLLPHLGSVADDLCFVHSLKTKSSTHGPAESVMSTGFTSDGFPSMGAWVSYALGSENQELPAFVSIEDPRGIPQAGPANWSSGFLPATFQGTPLSTHNPIRNLTAPKGVSAGTDGAAREALHALNESHLARFPGDAQLAARIASYELAARMQLAIPDVGDWRSEPEHVLKLYGADEATRSANVVKAQFAQNCILARRLIERGVRFVQLFNGAYASMGRVNWDGHNDMKAQYEVHAPILDQPFAALIRDLKQRGILEKTLVVLCTEFGRLPMFQRGTTGRDHNPEGFTCILAGAGVKTPFSYGATDEFGFRAVENPVDVHDFHATILHLMGIDHTRLTYYHNGLERRLTDVHGHVIEDVLAWPGLLTRFPGEEL